MMDIEQLEAISFNEMAERLPQVVSADGGLDPKSDRVRWIVWRIELPELQRELAGNRRIVVNKALHLLALHGLPPPDWLANEMLVRFPMEERKPAAISPETLAQLKAEAMALDNPDTAALEELAHRFGISLTHTKRLFKAELERLNRVIDLMD